MTEAEKRMLDLIDKISPAPWTYADVLNPEWVNEYLNSKFIINARNDVPIILDEIAKLRQENEELQEKIEHLQMEIINVQIRRTVNV